MIHSFYQFLGSLGYHHPIHPMVTHIPIGLTIGAIVFAIVSLLFRRITLKISAWHCAIVAIVGVVPTALFGYLDWQEKYHGVWSAQITLKIIFAAALFVFLLAALLISRKRAADAEDAARPWRSPRSIAVIVLYALSFFLVVGLGLEGGDLVYGSAPSTSATIAPTDVVSIAGQKIFTDNCSACHPGGGNSINAKYPVLKSPLLASESTFVAFIRDPKPRDGSDSQMSPFAPSDLSDANAATLYAYVVQAFKGL